MSKKAVLIILDGYGLAAPSAGNAVYMAKKPNLDRLFSANPCTTLQASGLDVGLPAGQMGNSEVGHTNIGAGRVVFQILPKMSQEIKNGKFFENKAYIKAMEDAKANGKSLHIMGLLSTGGVHSHLEHIFAILDMAKQRGVERVYVHCFLDGRDVAPKSGAGFVKELQDKCSALGNAKIATLQGRFWGMDRDKRWDRVEKGYNAIVCGEGVMDADAVHAVEASYAEDVTDEFVKPVVVDPAGVIGQGDSVIFMNFRPDRAREMTWALNLPDFDGFARKKTVFPLSYVCTAQYDETLPLPIAYPPEEIDNTLGDYVSAHGLKQFRVAETEKYAHVTFFFNGGVEKQIAGEERCLVPSPKEYPTYDLSASRPLRRMSIRSSSATSQTATWSATPASWPPLSPPLRRSMRAWAASWPRSQSTRTQCSSSLPTTAMPTACSTPTARSTPRIRRIPFPSRSACPALSLSPAASRISRRRYCTSWALRSQKR